MTTPFHEFIDALPEHERIEAAKRAAQVAVLTELIGPSGPSLKGIDALFLLEGLIDLAESAVSKSPQGLALTATTVATVKLDKVRRSLIATAYAIDKVEGRRSEDAERWTKACGRVVVLVRQIDTQTGRKPWDGAIRASGGSRNAAPNTGDPERDQQEPGRVWWDLERAIRALWELYSPPV